MAQVRELALDCSLFCEIVAFCLPYFLSNPGIPLTLFSPFLFHDRKSDETSRIYPISKREVTTYKILDGLGEIT